MASELKSDDASPQPNTDGVHECDVSKLPKNTEILQSKAISMLFTVIRDKNTSNSDYVFYSDRLCRILAEEALARLSESCAIIDTPCGKWKGPRPYPNGRVR